MFTRFNGCAPTVASTVILRLADTRPMIVPLHPPSTLLRLRPRLKPDRGTELLYLLPSRSVPTARFISASVVQGSIWTSDTMTRWPSLIARDSDSENAQEKIHMRPHFPVTRTLTRKTRTKTVAHRTWLWPEVRPQPLTTSRRALCLTPDCRRGRLCVSKHLERQSEPSSLVLQAFHLRTRTTHVDPPQKTQHTMASQPAD